MKSRFHEFIERIISTTCDQNQAGSLPLSVIEELVIVLGSRNEPPHGLQRVLEGLGYAVADGEIVGLALRCDDWWIERYGSLERALDETRSNVGKKYVQFLMNS